MHELSSCIIKSQLMTASSIVGVQNTFSRVRATPHSMLPSSLMVSMAAMPTQLLAATRGSLPSSPVMLFMTTSPPGRSGMASAVTTSPSPCKKSNCFYKLWRVYLGDSMTTSWYSAATPYRRLGHGRRVFGLSFQHTSTAQPIQSKPGPRFAIVAGAKALALF